MSLFFSLWIVTAIPHTLLRESSQSPYCMLRVLCLLFSFYRWGSRGGGATCSRFHGRCDRVRPPSCWTCAVLSPCADLGENLEVSLTAINRNFSSSPCADSMLAQAVESVTLESYWHMDVTYSPSRDVRRIRFPFSAIWSEAGWRLRKDEVGCFLDIDEKTWQSVES